MTMSNLRKAPSAVLNLGLSIELPRDDLGLHVVDDGIHPGDGVALALQFLAVELQRHAAQGIELAADELELDEQAGRAAGIVVAFLAGPRAQDARHQEADLARGEEFAGALARAFGELAQQIFVAAAEEIGLDVDEAEAVARIGEDFDDALQGGVADFALAVVLGGEIDDVEHAFERRVVWRRWRGSRASDVRRASALFRRANRKLGGRR